MTPFFQTQIRATDIFFSNMASTLICFNWPYKETNCVMLHFAFLLPTTKAKFGFLPLWDLGHTHFASEASFVYIQNKIEIFNQNWKLDKIENWTKLKIIGQNGKLDKIEHWTKLNELKSWTKLKNWSFLAQKFKWNIFSDDFEIGCRNRFWRRWNPQLLSHSVCVFIREELVCMLWCSWPSWWMSFWVKGHMSQSKRWFKLGVSLSKFPEWMRCHLCSSSSHLRKFVIVKPRWKKQIHIHLQVNDFLTPINSLTICLVAMSSELVPKLRQE